MASTYGSSFKTYDLFAAYLTHSQKALHASHDHPCSIDLTDVVPISTVDINICAEHKLEVLDLMYQLFRRYRYCKYQGTSEFILFYSVIFFLVELHFLNNNQTYQNEPFNRDVIDIELRFRVIASFLSRNTFGRAPHTIFRKSNFANQMNWSYQCDRIF